MAVRVVEQRMVPKRPGETGGDRVVATEAVTGVVDASSSKPWDPPSSPTTESVADRVCQALEGLDRRATLAEALERASAALAALKRTAGVAPDDDGCATFAVVCHWRRELWMCGDCQALIDGRLHVAPASAERIVAQARALVLSQRLLSGATVAQLRASDPGRETVMPLLASVGKLRNAAASPYGYAAIDGGDVATALVDCVALPDDSCEVVLATDGYPQVHTSLPDTEAALASRLRADPLLIGEPPATKGWAPHERSFDDRAFVRLHLPSEGST